MKAFGNFSRETKKAINEGKQNIQSNDYHRSLCGEVDTISQKTGKEILHRNITEKDNNPLILEDRPVDIIQNTMQVEAAKDFFKGYMPLKLVHHQLSRVRKIYNQCQEQLTSYERCQEQLSTATQDLKDMYQSVQACNNLIQAVQEVLEKDFEKQAKDQIQTVSDEQSKKNEQSGEQTRDHINTFVHNQLVKICKGIAETAKAIGQSGEDSNSDAKATLKNMLQRYRQSKKLIQELQEFDMEPLKANLIKAGDSILNKYFTGRFLARLQEKHIAVPPDLRYSFDRHMDIKKVRSKCGDEVARIFAALKGEIVMIKSERMSYDENIAKKFRERYDRKYNENRAEKGKFEVNINTKASGKEEFYGTVYLNNQAIGVERSCRINNKSLQFSQLLGEILKDLAWEDSADKAIKQIDHNQIENNETTSAIHLFIKGAKAKCKKGTEKGTEEDFAIANGLIEEGGIEIHEVKYEMLKRIVGTFKVNKIGTDAYLAILGTPNGRSQQYLLKEYKQYLGNREITNIEVKYEFDDGQLFIGKIRFHIDEKPILS